MTQNISTVRRTEKEGRRKKKREYYIYITLHITYITYTKFYHMSSICIYKLYIIVMITGSLDFNLAIILRNEKFY